jgi:hypothetical protein
MVNSQTSRPTDWLTVIQRINNNFKMVKILHLN